MSLGDYDVVLMGARAGGNPTRHKPRRYIRLGHSFNEPKHHLFGACNVTGSPPMIALSNRALAYMHPVSRQMPQQPTTQTFKDLMMQKRDEADDLYAERDLLNTRVIALETDLSSAQSRVESLQTQLARNNDELLTYLNDLVAIGHLLRNEEQKCKKLAADYRIAKKGVQARELKLNNLHAEIDSLRQKFENEVQHSLGIRAEKKKTDKKLIALRVRFEALSRKNIGYERHFKLSNKRIALNQANAVTLSKIMDEMVKRKITFPVLSNPSKLFAAIPDSSARRWQKFCQSLAQEGIFDPESYLALHPDVAASGVDPLVHFLTRGLAEHRTLTKAGNQ